MTKAPSSSDPICDGAPRTRSPGRKRDSLLLIARLQLGSDPVVHDVRVRNLSEGGVMAEFDQAVANDTIVSLELRGVGRVAGRTVWCEQRRIGIAFDHPVDPLLARKPVGRGSKTSPYAKPAL